MPRSLTTAAKSATEAAHVRVVYLVFMDFSSGALYATTAPDQFVYGGNTYLGLGKLGRISTVAETGEQKAAGMQFNLSGIPAAQISIALTEHYQGRDVTVKMALLDADYTIIADPILIFSGLMDTMDMTVGATAEIAVGAESRLSRWEKALGLRYNHAVQSVRYPGDLGLEFVEQMAEKELVWPNG